MLTNFKNFIKTISTWIQTIKFDDLKNYINKFYLFLKNTSLKILKIYFKFTIRLVHFFTENTLAYLLYIFLIAYGCYGGRDTNVYEPSHFIAFFIVLYLWGSAFELYVLCKIPKTRRFLDNLVTKEYVTKYLGEHTSSKLLLKYSVPMIALGSLEVFTAREAFNANTAQLNDTYDKTHGADGEKWDAKTKAAYHKEAGRIRDTRQGIVTHMVNSEQTKSLINGISSTAKETINAFFGRGTS